MPLVLLLFALLFVRVAGSRREPSQGHKGDPEPMKRPQEDQPGLASELDRAQEDLDELQAQEAGRLRRHLAELRTELIRARRRPATPERIHRLRELQTVTLIMIELLQEEDRDG